MALNQPFNKMVTKYQKPWIFLLLLLSFSDVLITKVIAQEVTVAVASNFYPSLKIIKQAFELQTPHQLTIVSGSTGKLYSQIIYGAPFDVFMSADKQTPLLLEENGFGLKDSRFTYAIGQLVLWSANNDVFDINALGGSVLRDKKINKVAIANPKLAPYGRAAEEALQSMSCNNVKEKLVIGESISQVFHLIASGSAEVGFVALSQIKNPSTEIGGSYWLVPESYHQPIEQQVIALEENDATKAFLGFLRSAKAIEIIQSFGYRVEVNSTPDTIIDDSVEN